MNVALILAGGVGNRMKMGNFPKQYLMVRQRPIIDYCLCTFQKHPLIDCIVIVADEQWRGFIDSWLQNSRITKFSAYSAPGENRQLSIFNGLKIIKDTVPTVENVIIHDAARPLIPNELITNCLQGLNEADGVMPVLPVKDTCYQSKDGKHICGFLPRNQLFAGQAPEAFHFNTYLHLHQQLPVEYLLQISGSSEIAYKQGLKVIMIPGAEINFKITTSDDLTLFEKFLDCEAQ
jgi:2-C-methyl-D-erythritol 4-phosphate cytidylyltransferase